MEIPLYPSLRIAVAYMRNRQTSGRTYTDRHTPILWFVMNTRTATYTIMYMVTCQNHDSVLAVHEQMSFMRQNIRRNLINPFMINYNDTHSAKLCCSTTWNDNAAKCYRRCCVAQLYCLSRLTTSASCAAIYADTYRNCECWIIAMRCVVCHVMLYVVLI